ncbi:acyltransferase [Sphingomonas sp.]|jgi:peptidoglycan/LPS O-acetylase OafA/YrhL|uniref:acyltransferase family protein n=1 Tax=Sphingomonas sp. TaxID=28214 RepID=UPI002ED7A42B
MSGELRALTGARGIAAWLVVLFHLRFMMAGIGGAAGPMALGYLAVDFFFVLSGFVIWLTYAEKLRAEGPAGIPRFLKRRIARVWPLHMFVLAGAIVFSLIIALLDHPDWSQYPPAELPLHILLVQNWGFTDRLTWNVPAWSISCELAAYLLFPWLVIATDFKRWPSWALIAAAAGIAAALHLVFTLRGVSLLGADIVKMSVLRCLAEFAIGMLTCALWLRWRARPLLPALAAGAAGAAILALHVEGLAPQTFALPLVFGALVLVLALTSEMRGNPLASAPVHYLGEISYATYLGHWMLWMGFKLAFIHDHDMGWGLFALFLLLVFAVSVALYHLVERPAQRWINDWKPLRRAAATI